MTDLLEVLVARVGWVGWVVGLGQVVGWVVGVGRVVGLAVAKRSTGEFCPSGTVEGGTSATANERQSLLWDPEQP